ncbi:uncharacterized protein LACBIDRAFT_311421 [Laccaria bicolor S238N-H82]|uniref:Predicted protein n=1 Tax=Laccaria bicolor (strain S238N-H82 / ATCC MYA-4686) TaxID=486041 RepID=B0CZY7_LACBS|nr:uncharacterized protein LACBIDRAFT_311421 [Laccaria bicolor S238N-H82]EDR12234.1 predicted protein [Laccaria bicolor S238N-H82]|eukprot:XP_001876498.1 predicted protein [Laccaria bicolor S238N-H82]
MRCVDRVWACCRVSGLPCLGIFARCVGRVSSFGWLHVASHLGVLPLRLLCHVSRVYASVAYSRCQSFGWLHVASRRVWARCRRVSCVALWCLGIFASIRGKHVV